MLEVPQVLGQERVRRLLGLALRHGRFPQALLIAGPAGIGKRALGRQLAAALLCSHPAEDGWGCGRCRSCRAVASGAHPDLHWLEADPNTKLTLEAVRPWHTQASGLTPAWGERVVGVVVPAEELTEAAQNSLLKVIEEPPPTVTWLLLTANPAALLATIRSRCQLVQLDPVPARTIADWLVSAQQQEPSRAQEIARLAAGRPGVALEWVQDSRAESLRQEVSQVLMQMGRGRAAELLEVARAWSEAGDHLARRLELLALGWRDLVVVQAWEQGAAQHGQDQGKNCQPPVPLYFPELRPAPQATTLVSAGRLLACASRALALARQLSIWGSARLQLEALLVEAETAWKG
ncbi:MAG: DNA polymerase III subunit [Limnochordaceae bacterium]|nr:DNA polymerase III subunit [Limnochordaceae bacterium]